jgi:hypothetical protein
VQLKRDEYEQDWTGLMQTGWIHLFSSSPTRKPVMSVCGNVIPVGERRLVF